MTSAPTVTLPPQPWLTAPATRRLLAVLAEEGPDRDARFIGGCVRDAWLGWPVSDYDVATPLTPPVVMARLKAAGLPAIPTGLAHGTVTAVVDGIRFEITTLRRDVDCDGRHAEVAFSDDWRVDASRRDFTFNALSCRADGTVFDPFGGIEDLAARRVRFIGSAQSRIREDVLRLLRFFRFQARYGGPVPDPEGLEACHRLAPLLSGLSAERVGAEVFRILATPRCAEVWRLMLEQGVMPHLLPEALQPARLARLIALEQILGLSAPAPSLAGTDRVLVRLAAVLATDAAGAGRVARGLRLSRHEGIRLKALIAPPVAVTLTDRADRWRRALVRLGDSQLFRDLILLAAAGETGAVSEVMPTLTSPLAWADAWAAAAFPLTGHDVLAAGVPPGPEVRRGLMALGLWWADQAFRPDRDACLAQLAGWAAGLGSR